MRLIDADELDGVVMRHNSKGGNITRYDYKRISALLIEFSTVDAEPVIRCKNCKYRDPEDHKCDCGHDIRWQLPREDNWFCADAERKEE